LISLEKLVLDEIDSSYVVKLVDSWTCCRNSVHVLCCWQNPKVGQKKWVGQKKQAEIAGTKIEFRTYCI
jgi:hypothetical protein